MRKKQTTPSAFDNAFESLGFSNPMGATETTNMDNVDTFEDVEIDNNEPEPPVEEPEEKEEPVEKEDDTKIPQEVLDQMNKKSSSDQIDNSDKGLGDEPNNEDLAEAEQVGALFDAVAESFGWNIDDIEEDDRPVTVDDLTNYLKEVVNQNSVPQYADERIQQLDEYVKNGGKFEDFYATKQQELSYDTLDIEDEVNQKAVVRELLKLNGYSDDQITNKINRYEDADMLEEEASEALTRLKAVKAEQTRQLQEQQAALRAQQEEQQRQFFTDMNTQINALNDIRGIAIPKEDRKELFDYIFKQDAQGLTQYQKDFQKNLAKNLIESAYFCKNADKFVNGAKKAGETSAANKLRTMLRHTSRNHSSYNADEDKQRPAWEIASKFL